MLRDPYELNEYDAEIQAEERRWRRSAGDWTIPVISTLAMLGIVGGLYYYQQVRQSGPAEEEASPTASMEKQEPKAAPKPDVRYPIQRPEPERAKPLPPLAKSDPEVRSALGEIVSKDSLRRFNLDSIIRRVIVTADNLPRDKIPQRYSLAKPIEKRFHVSGRDGEYAITVENHQRYTPYVRMLEAVDTKQMVNLYVYFYPLLQEEYRNIGSPKQYFNDRVVEVIDHLLAAPEVKEPVKLVQPKVFYEFADPSLESLSAGQKLMIRMGADNAVRVKIKLREIRKELVAIR
jgi:hypothetical protein